MNGAWARAILRARRAAYLGELALGEDNEQASLAARTVTDDDELATDLGHGGDSAHAAGAHKVGRVAGFGLRWAYLTMEAQSEQYNKFEKRSFGEHKQTPRTQNGPLDG